MLPKCPKCESIYCYEDGNLIVCPECAHEFKLSDLEPQVKKYYDCNNNELVDGDTVTVIKDLKVGSSSLVVKQGTRVKNIRLVDEDHDIICKIDKMGQMRLKTMYVKKI